MPNSETTSRPAPPAGTTAHGAVTGATHGVTSTGSARLRGNMGTFQLVIAVLSFTGPPAMMAGLVPIGTAYGSGIATPLVFVVLGLIMAIFSVGYLVMARKIPRTGALYSFITAGLGRPMGLGGSFVAVVGYTIGMIGTATFLAISLQALFPIFDWWVWALIAVPAVGILGYIKIDVSAKVMAVLLVVGFAFILVYDAVVIFTNNEQGALTLDSFNPFVFLGGGGASVVGITLLITTLSGFEATAVYADEVRAPRRTIPRATYISIAIMVGFYALSGWALIQSFGGTPEGIGAMAQSPSTAFLDSTQLYLGTVAFHAMGIIVLLGTFVSASAMHNVVSRYIFNLGVDRILPPALGVVHPRFGSPARASVTLSVVTAVFFAIAALTAVNVGTLYSTLIGLLSLGFIVLLTLASIGIAVYLIRTKPTDVGVWQRLWAPVLAVIVIVALLTAVLTNINLITNNPVISLFAVVLPVGALVLGVIVALVVRSRRPDIYAHIGTRD